MDGDIEEVSKSNEQHDQEEDESENYSTFFLQPAAFPYNIAQKVEEANVALYNSPIKSEKSPKVRFKDDLVSFDAQLTDDDVVSIESDNTEIPFMEQQTNQTTMVLEYKTNDSSMFSIDEDEIIEEIECEMENIKIDQNNKNIEIEEVAEQKAENEIQNNNKTEPQETIERTPEPSNEKEKRRKKLPHFIDCRFHCIERLDTELSDSMRKLALNEKPPVCPPLKLIDRKCCARNHKKNPTSLPKYDGLRSEYGLNIEQIIKRGKLKEMIRTKQEKRQELLDEYKKKKEEINEQVFCKWLKEISERKHQTGFKEYKMSLSKVKDLPNQNRPVSSKSVRRGVGSSESGYSSKTSSEKGKRPKSCSQSVYVEVPKSVLQRGINVECLLNNFKYHSKKLYITIIS